MSQHSSEHTRHGLRGAEAKVLILIPTYNEADNIVALVDSIRKHAPDADLLFIDDNSQDKTQELILAAQKAWLDGNHPHLGNIHLLKRPGKQGLGSAYRAGFSWGLKHSYAFMIEMDADLSHNPAYLPTMIEKLNDHDVAIGSRYVPGGGTRDWGLLRRMISQFGSFYARTILSMKERDLTGGFNGWRVEVIQALQKEQLESEGYAFQIELKFRAKQLGFRLCEFPITFVDRRVGQSKMSLRIIVEGMLRVWRFRMQKRAPTLASARQAQPDQKTDP